MSISKEASSPHVREAMAKDGVIFASSTVEVLLSAEVGPTRHIALIAAGDIDTLVSKWNGVDEKFPSWFPLREARVLDIAAGSVYTTEHVGFRYDPHFSRLCAINGAEVVAIDIKIQSESDKMLFRSIEADLIPLVLEEKLSELEGLQGQQFDIIHSNDFAGRNPDPRLYTRLGDKLVLFRHRLISECAKLLAEGGVMSLDTVDRLHRPVIYRMLNGRLEMESALV